MGKRNDGSLSRSSVAVRWIVLVGVMLGAMFVASKMSGGSGVPIRPAIGRGTVPAGPILVIAGVTLVIFVAAYIAMIQSTGFIFDVYRPVMSRLKVRLFLARIVLPLLLGTGLCMGLAIPLQPMLNSIGVNSPWDFRIPLLGGFMLVQVALVSVNIYKPLEVKLIRKRLSAMDVTDTQLDLGHPMGLSDPAKSSWKKFTLVEEDIGMFWFERDRLVYKGDDDDFQITREQLQTIERDVDGGSTSAMAGAVNVVIGFLEEDGQVRKVRLHPQGLWTLKSSAAAMDQLERNLLAWQANELKSPFGVCPQCRYELRGNTSEQCPECGCVLPSQQG